MSLNNKPLKNKIFISIITIITFISTNYVKYFYAYAVFGVDKWEAMTDLKRNILVCLFQLVLVLFVSWFMLKKSPLKILGLSNGFSQGLTWAFIFSLPMFIGYPILSPFNSDLNFGTIFKDLIAAGFFEEFVFRGFLFGILFFYAGWGFIPAALIAALYFGSGHLYQATNFGEAVTVFLFTALASIGFALFYLVWKSLWLPIFLHAFMDLTWDMFNLQGGAVGNPTANIFRFTTIALAIFFTVRKMKQDKELLKGKLLVNPALTKVDAA